MSLLTTLLGRNAAGGIPGVILAPADMATTGNLTTTYDNGASGRGATLTANSSGALTIDGISANVGDRVLVKNQTDETENGVYVVTVAGGMFTAYVLTRAADFDEPSEITPGIIIGVSYGTVNQGTLWQQTAEITTIGTDDILFALVLPGALTANRAVVTDGSGALSASTTTDTEIGYVGGVTSPIQTQFASKISQSGAQIYAADTGSANALEVALNPAIATLVAGMTLRVLPASNNTGASTIDVGTGAESILKYVNQQLVTGDIVTNQPLLIIWDGTNWQLLNPAVPTDLVVTTSITSALLDIDNLRLDGNTLSSTDTNGNISALPNGSGEFLTKADPVSDLGVATKQYVDNKYTWGYLADAAGSFSSGTGVVSTRFATQVTDPEGLFGSGFFSAPFDGIWEFTLSVIKVNNGRACEIKINTTVNTGGTRVYKLFGLSGSAYTDSVTFWLKLLNTEILAVFNSENGEVVGETLDGVSFFGGRLIKDLS